MDPRTDSLDDLLVTLGKAHQDGAFAGGAGPCPWRNGRAGAQSFKQRRFSWARLGGSLAAAAAVAVLYVGTGPLTSVKTGPIDPVNVDPVVIAEGPETPVAVVPVICQDYNNDGQINGADIQGIVNNRLKGGKPVDVQEFIQVCLLGKDS